MDRPAAYLQALCRAGYIQCWSSHPIGWKKLPRVSVVATVHEPLGTANVAELVAILERLGPDVIFLEIPPAAFPDYLSGIRNNLESTAARHYRKFRGVELVPVDLPTPDASFFRSDQQLHEYIEKASPDYCRLLDWHSQYVRAYGFRYLNSEYCVDLWSDLDEAIRVALHRAGDARLAGLRELWKDTIKRREKAMIKKIEDYATRHHVDQGVLLVGAAHQQSLVDLARAASVAQPSIQWDSFRFPD